jgi:alkylation response protein AidB-like acyl-CoA dehydrogenase
MKIEITPEDRAFREEVRDWLADNAPKAQRPDGGQAQRDFDVAWRRRQYDGGWGHISWPEAYGGRGLPVSQQLIWYEECARAHAPPAQDMFFVALNHAGPTVIARGDERQKAFHLPRILKGESIWCQGFSEPSAGSDLASLRTKAVLDGDDLVVTGQKIWTTNGHHAQFQELLVRTDPDAPKHKGITWVIAEMGAPGMDIRPIRNMAGERHFCEVFYDEVRIPLSNVVGGLNNGWSVAMSTLAFERGTASIPHLLEIGAQTERLIDVAKTRPGWDGRPAIQDEAIASKLSRLRADVAALRSLAYLSISRAERTQAVGAEASIVRLLTSEITQRVHALAMEILGPSGLELSDIGDWSYDWLVSFKQTIAGGTSEIQRNIIGERMLGLPKGS